MPDSFGARFGRLIKRVRGDLGVTQPDLADQVFGDRARKGDISKLENGRVPNPQAETVAKICGALGIDPTEVEALHHTNEDDTPEIVQRLLAEKEAHANDLKVAHALVVSLAYRYAEGNPGDFDGALKGLERALEVAAEERAKGDLPSNTSDAVDVVLRRIDDLNDAGRVEDGVAEIRRALAAQADEVERQKAAQGRMFDKGIAQAVLARDVDLAVEMELGKLELEGGGFEDLRSVRRVWYERGRDKGLRFDLEVAIALAEIACDRASDADEKGNALNDLGLALWTLGQRQSGTDQLEQAVTAYRAALEAWTRDRVPLDWAMTQNNLGNALWTLGQRESGTERLEQAVIAYHAALEEWTRDRVPTDWAMTQNNLGVALKTLGERESGTERLEQAVTAYRAALEERTRDRVPLDWAMTQENMALVYLAMAEKADPEEQGPLLSKALTHVDLALEVFDPAETPYNHDKASRLRDALMDALQ
ncbi:helix-turn-helix domain-containing protein [Falsiphaeobacter marinintestinus]|uniref:helix-turn-helix domain-containing protein n=1 Tax=Falsiphaeobacter marinintestinus TaxID=1492905 RepID=UPI0011B49BA2|nr:helix-turn-helix transcriptional regulator [Phaeobacter marinintestinus]